MIVCFLSFYFFLLFSLSLSLLSLLSLLSFLSLSSLFSLSPFSLLSLFSLSSFFLFANQVVGCDLVEPVHAIVSWFDASKLRQWYLLDAQKQAGFDPIYLISKNETRWSSTFMMLERFIKLSPFVKTALAQDPDAPAMIEEHDISCISTLKEILGHFALATEKLEGDHLTLPLVLPTLSDLRKYLSGCAGVKDVVSKARFGKVFLAAFDKWFEKYFNSTNLALCAAALHPVYGKLEGISPAVRDDTWALLLSTARRLDSPPPDDPDGFYVPPPYAEVLALVRAKFEEASFTFPPTGNALQWWNKPSLLPLHPLLRYLWAVPASSSSAERLFSALGHFQNRAPQRSIATLENLYRVRDYQRQTKYNYGKIEELISPFREEQKKKQSQ